MKISKKQLKRYIREQILEKKDEVFQEVYGQTDEMSTSAGAGSYLSAKAFKPTRKDYKDRVEEILKKHDDKTRAEVSYLTESVIREMSDEDEEDSIEMKKILDELEDEFGDEIPEDEAEDIRRDRKDKYESSHEEEDLDIMIDEEENKYTEKSKPYVKGAGSKKPDQVELGDDYITGVNEMDEESWSKKSGASLNPHPRKVGKSTPSEEELIESIKNDIEEDSSRYEQIYNKIFTKEEQDDINIDFDEDETDEEIDFNEGGIKIEKNKNSLVPQGDDAVVEWMSTSISDLMGEDGMQFIESFDYVAPNPTTMRVNLKNGSNYLLSYGDRSSEARVSGKKYYLLNQDEMEYAAEAISRLLDGSEAH